MNHPEQQLSNPVPPNAGASPPDAERIDVSPGVRERIAREATRLFSARGYNGVSVREIVEAAGVTKPTLYYYYPSKEVLFQRILVESLQDFRRKMEEAGKHVGSVRERLLAITQVQMDFARCNTEHCLLIHSLILTNEYKNLDFDLLGYFRDNTEILVQVMRDGIASGDLAPADPHLMALMFQGQIHILIIAIMRDPAALPSTDVAGAVVDMALAGLAARAQA